MTEEEERARCEDVVRHCTSSIGLVDLNSAAARRVLVPMAIQLRAEAFEAGRKSRDLEFVEKDVDHNVTHANLVRVADLLAACKAKLARVEAAALEAIDAWNLWTGQEMYGEHIREGMPPSDFEAWESSIDGLRAALADSGDKP